MTVIFVFSIASSVQYHDVNEGSGSWLLANMVMSLDVVQFWKKQK